MLSDEGTSLKSEQHSGLTVGGRSLRIFKDFLVKAQLIILDMQVLFHVIMCVTKIPKVWLTFCGKLTDLQNVSEVC